MFEMFEVNLPCHSTTFMKKRKYNKIEINFINNLTINTVYVYTTYQNAKESCL